MRVDATVYWYLPECGLPVCGTCSLKYWQINSSCTAHIHWARSGARAHVHVRRSTGNTRLDRKLTCAAPPPQRQASVAPHVGDGRSLVLAGGMSWELATAGSAAAAVAAIWLALQSGDVLYDARLVEMDFGTWEMKAWDAISRAEVDAWAADMCAFCPGGGESALCMASRIRAFLDALRRREHDHAVVVCHGGSIRLMEACLQHYSLEEAALSAARRGRAIAYGELLVIDC